MRKALGAIILTVLVLDVAYRVLVRKWLRAVIDGPKPSGFSRNGIKPVRRA